ncbi:MAG: TonB-dependent receptor plug domain-containing protein, partial [Opitutales bacterium]
MVFKYIKSNIAFFMLAGATASALFGKNPETLEGMQIDGLKYNELDLSRATMLSGSDVESLGVSSISSLSALSPNLYINSYGIQSYGDVITLRGVGNSQLFGDPAVGLYVDGIPQGSTATYSNALFDVESVEVLQGYHAHQFGKNSPGGVINVSSRKAGDTHRSKLYASYGSFNTQGYRVLADGPTGEHSSYYFGLNRSGSDGYADNLNPSGNDATSESWNGRLGFEFKIFDGFEIVIGGTWEEFDLGAQPVVHRNSASGFYQRNSDLNEIGVINSNSQHIKVSAKTEFGGIKSVASHNEWKLNPNIIDLNYADMGLSELSAILDAVGNPISSTSRIEEKHDDWSEELSFFSEEDSSSSWSVMMIASTNEVIGKAERNYPMPTVAQTDPTYFNTGVMLPASSTTSYEIDTESFALSTQISRKLSEGVTCEIGLRVDHVSRDLQRSKVNSLSPSPSDISAKKDYTWVSPTISLRNDLNQNFAAFFNSSLTEKPGGFSPFVDSTGLIAA